MSLQLTAVWKHQWRSVNTKYQKQKKERKKDVNDVVVGTLLKTSHIRETGKLMDLLTDAILRRVKKNSKGFADIFGNFHKDPMTGTSYMSYDSFCKSCINVLRLQFTKAIKTVVQRNR